MEQKKDDKSYSKNLEEAQSKVIQKLITKYPELQYDTGLGYGVIPTKYEKEYQKMVDEELKRIDKNYNSKTSDEKQDLQKHLQEKDKKIDELIDTLKRLQAEFENYKKRVEKEKTEFVKYAHADVVAQMLSVLDSFEIALKNTSDKEKFVEGIKIIFAQFYSILEAEGLKPIKTDNGKFDPYRHEVLMKEESDKPEGTILEEFQKGYMLNDKVLRFSKVKISGK